MAQHFRGNLRILGKISSPNSLEINTDHTVATSVELIHTFVACYHCYDFHHFNEWNLGNSYYIHVQELMAAKQLSVDHEASY